MKKIFVKKYAGLWLCLSFILCLPACMSNNRVPVNRIEQMGAQLQKHGHVVWIQRGAFARFVLYKDLFFEPNTLKVRDDRFSELTLIAELLNTMDNRAILVTGHSDSVKSEKERLRESDVMARNIAAFLWSKGVAYQRMQVFGLSDKKQIAEENTPFGSAYNRRVEILVPLDALH